MLSDRFRNDYKPSLRLTELQDLEIENFYKRLKEGVYKFEYIQCPVCDSNEFSELSEKDRYGLPCQAVLCENCGLALTNPRLTQDSYNHFYDSNYRAIYLGKTNDDDKHSYFNLQYQRAKYKYSFISNEFPDLKSIKVLEVGCAAGGILKFFKDQGASVTGIDLGEEYLEFGRKEYGLDLRKVNLFDLDTNEKYDLIIYSHVFEHILDPGSHLIFLKKILKSTGKVFIEVPGLKYMHNTYGDLLLYLQNAHVYHFTLNSLRNFLEPAGYRLIRGNEKILSFWEMSEQRKAIEFNEEVASIKKYLRYQEFFVVRTFNILKIRLVGKVKAILKLILIR